ELRQLGAREEPFPRRVLGEEFDFLADWLFEPSPTLICKISDPPEDSEPTIDCRIADSSSKRLLVFLSHPSSVLQVSALNEICKRVGIAFRALTGLLVRDFRFKPVL